MSVNGRFRPWSAAGGGGGGGGGGTNACGCANVVLCRLAGFTGSFAAANGDREFEFVPATQSWVWGGTTGASYRAVLSKAFETDCPADQWVFGISYYAAGYPTPPVVTVDDSASPNFNVLACPTLGEVYTTSDGTTTIIGVDP